MMLGGVSVEAVRDVAGHALDLFGAALLFLGGLEIGIRRGNHLAPDRRSPLQRFVAFWLAGTQESDGKVRVNYTRATAFGGLVGFFVITVVVLHKYEASEKPELEPLVLALVAALAMLGINLGQYGIASIRDVKMVQANNPAPPAPPAPPAAAPATQVNVTAAGGPTSAAPPRRDSGLGNTQLIPATDPPPDNPPPG